METIPYDQVIIEQGRALDNEELERMTGGRCNIMRYQDIKQASNIDDVLGKYGACIILYELKKNDGHWVLVMNKGKDTLIWFDSYGVEPDGEARFVKDSNWKKKSWQDIPLVSLLMKISHYKKFIYNTKRLQKLEKGINTCGRHCVTYLLNRDIPLNRYVKTLRSMPEDPDFTVTLYTLDK